MAQLTLQQTADALFKAGFTAQQAVTMIAIAMGESGLKSDAVCHDCVPGVQEYSVGPWQINLYAHPWVTQECAMDVYCAAKAAYAISDQGANFQPWTVYTSGKYKEFLGSVRSALAQLGLIDPGSASDGGGGAGGGTGQEDGGWMPGALDPGDFGVPGAEDIAGGIWGAAKDVIGGVVPSEAEIRDGALAVVVLVVGVGFALLGAYGLVSKSDVGKSVISGAKMAATKGVVS